MTADILAAMAAALLLTLLFEGLFAAVWGVKGGRSYLIIFLANVMTNPVVNIVHSFCAYELRWDNILMVILTAFLEISAVIAEWLVYKSRTDIKKPFLFSLGANSFSFLCGIILNCL